MIAHLGVELLLEPYSVRDRQGLESLTRLSPISPKLSLASDWKVGLVSCLIMIRNTETKRGIYFPYYYDIYSLSKNHHSGSGYSTISNGVTFQRLRTVHCVITLGRSKFKFEQDLPSVYRPAR